MSSPDASPRNAAVPADGGLTGLALFMQLAGTLTAAVTAAIAFPAIVTSLKTSRFVPGGTTTLTLWMLVLGGGGLARAMLHRAAGTELLYPPPGDASRTRAAFTGIHRYVVVAAVHSVLFVVFFATKAKAPMSHALAMGAMFALWPATLAVIVRLPRFAGLAEALPPTEDKGFEGASILMLLMGVCGVGVAVVILTALLQLPSVVLRQGPILIMLLVVALLGVRSVLHVVAGYRGLAETSIDRATEATTRYANVAILAAIATGVAGVLAVAWSSTLHSETIAILVCLVWGLLAWPMIVQRFFAERQFADALAGGDAAEHQRAKDLGLTSLGWLLIAMSIFGLSMTIPTLVMTQGGWGPMAMFRVDSAAHSPWWGLVTGGLPLWAGIELVAMSHRARLAATIYGVVGAGLTIWLQLPVLRQLDQLGVAGSPGLSLIAVSLVLPLATIWLVTRDRTPRAVARVREP
ncbi:MAG: hypothetical protein R2939_09415 [Kofleriaceae bacterium]